MRQRIFEIVQRAQPGDRLSHLYDIFIVFVAFLSIVPLMFGPQDAGSGLARGLNLLDIVTVYILFFDYIMRWATHDIRTGKKGWREFAKYPFTPLAIIDLLAILPSLGVLPETFKFLRVLRITKMFRYSKSLTIVANVFRSEKNTLLSVLVVALVYMFVSGLIMFVNEPDTFGTFFNALYWANTALTTIGYGDLSPTTDLGKLVSMVSAFFGMAVIALPAGIVTGGFLEQIRQSQQNREAYFRTTERHQQAFKVRKEKVGGPRAYFKAHPKVAAYAVTMAVCFLVDEVLYAVSVVFGTPVWLDTVGTALAAILLEPAAGLIIAFANNLVQAVQFGDAGNMLYYALGALAAIVFGTLYARGKKITLKSIAWTALILVGVGTAVSCVLAFAVSGGNLSTPTQHWYYELLGMAGLSGAPAIVATLFLDKLVDAAAVFVIVVFASRAIVGSRIDPKRWFGTESTQAANAQAEGLEARMSVDGIERVSDCNAASGAAAGLGVGGVSGFAAGCDEMGLAAEGEGACDLDARRVLGLDVGGTYTKAGVFNLDGDLLGTHAFPTPHVLADWSHAQLLVEFKKLLADTDTEPGAVVAVGLAVPGVVSAEDTLRMCPNIDLDLRSYRSFLLSLFPRACIAVLNDANAAVLGDRWRGSSHDCNAGTVALVTLGTGVGAGLVIDGELYEGRRGGAGELGHMCVDPEETEPCTCGRAGCMDQYASATGLVNRARKEFVSRAQQADVAVQAAAVQAAGEQDAAQQDAAQQAAARQVPAEQLAAKRAAAQQAAVEAFPDARTVLSAADRRDPAARAALNHFTDALGFGLAQLACLIDPDLIVLGGGLSERADLYLEDVQARFRACAMFTCKETPIVASVLGNKCGMYGAAYHALESWEKKSKKSAS